MNEAIVWGPVNVNNLHKFTFEDKHSAGFNEQLYGNFYNKSAFEFYEYFVDNDLLSMMVCIYLYCIPTNYDFCKFLGGRDKSLRPAMSGEK